MVAWITAGGRNFGRELAISLNLLYNFSELTSGDAGPQTSFASTCTVILQAINRNLKQNCFFNIHRVHFVVNILQNKKLGNHLNGEFRAYRTFFFLCEKERVTRNSRGSKWFAWTAFIRRKIAHFTDFIRLIHEIVDSFIAFAVFVQHSATRLLCKNRKNKNKQNQTKHTVQWWMSIISVRIYHILNVYLTNNNKRMNAFNSQHRIYLFVIFAKIMTTFPVATPDEQKNRRDKKKRNK